MMGKKIIIIVVVTILVAASILALIYVINPFGGKDPVNSTPLEFSTEAWNRDIFSRERMIDSLCKISYATIVD